MKSLIKEYLDMYIDTHDLTLTEEQYASAYHGVENWLSEMLSEAVSESINNVV
ncbi:hypothetical protein [Virgibacillus halophilus]|uniref:hypothetical protein n=1 Tax=Tigheibacillus halophilus TaxID=361280 RepID=UPI0036F38475